MSASLLALASALAYGAADFLGGLTARRASTLAVVFASQAVGLLALLAALVFLPAASVTVADAAWGALAGLAGGVGVALLYRALAIGTMAVVAPTTAVCAVVIPVAAGVLAGERPHAAQLSGIALAMAAIVLVSQEPRRAGTAPEPGLPRGLAIAFASGVAIGVFFLALARAHAAAGMWPLVAARATSGLLFGIAALVSGHGHFRMDRRAFVMAAAGGVLDMFANALYVLATRLAPLSIVVTLASLYPASTVMLARVVLGERLGRVQLAGIVTALVAIALIVR